MSDFSVFESNYAKLIHYKIGYALIANAKFGKQLLY